MKAEASTKDEEANKEWKQKKSLRDACSDTQTKSQDYLGPGSLPFFKKSQVKL